MLRKEKDGEHCRYYVGEETSSGKNTVATLVCMEHCDQMWFVSMDIQSMPELWDAVSLQHVIWRAI